MATNVELRKMDAAALTDHLLSLRKKEFQLRMQKANGSLEKPHVFKVIRREIARVKTIMTEKAGK